MKSKGILLLLIAVFMISTVCTSCSSINNPRTETIKVEWPYYNSYSELFEASSLIIEGRVVSISYAVIDYKYAQQVNDCKNDLDNKMLYTVYTVEVIDVLKGETGQTISLAIIGGRDDKDLDLQKQVLDQSGLSKLFNHIPILTESKVRLAEGDVCVFSLHKFGDFFTPINLEQFAFSQGSKEYYDIKERLKTEE